MQGAAGCRVQLGRRGGYLVLSGLLCCSTASSHRRTLCLDVRRLCVNPGPSLHSRWAPLVLPDASSPCCARFAAPQVSLNYHMKCEQYTHSATRSFFNFNGTAGRPGGGDGAGMGQAAWEGLGGPQALCASHRRHQEAPAGLQAGV